MKCNKLHISVILISLFLGFSSVEIHAQKAKPIIKGVVNQYTSTDSIELFDALDRSRKIIEKAKVDKKGNFQFHYNPADIGFYTLVFHGGKNVLIVISPNSAMELTIDALKGIITKTQGSKENDVLKQFYGIMTAMTQKKDSLEKIYKTNQDPIIQNQLMALDQEWGKQITDLSLKNKSNFASAFLIENLPSDVFFSVHDTVLSELITLYPNNTFIKAKFDEIASAKKTAIGSFAPEIALPDTNGNIIKLSSLRGKVVIVDFWASWCGPCRKEGPNMVKIYQTYHDKGLEIYGVSLDQSRANWIGAINSDGFNWIHVSDLKRWQCQAGLDYGIRSIPATVLIGRDGRIIAKDLRGEELAAKVKEVLGKE